MKKRILSATLFGLLLSGATLSWALEMSPTPASPQSPAPAEPERVETRAEEVALPVADLLDVQFTDDGNAVDVSPMQMEVKTMGTPEVALNEKFGRNSARMTNAYGAGTSNYYRVEYSENQAFKDALADGHSLEVLFSVNYEKILDKEAKPFSGHEGGGTGLMINGSGRGYELNFLPHVGGAYRWAQSGIVPSPFTYYHMVGVWNKEAGKAYIYINGKLAGEASAEGDLKFPATAAQWFGIGGDASGNMEAQSANNWEIVAARIYDKPLEGGEVEALWYDLCGTDMTEPDKHQWDENGVCSTCGELNDEFVSTDEDGYFLVGNVQQWNWVRTYIATRKASVKVRLTADLDLSGLQNPSLPTFRGTLDGQGHSVKLDIVAPETTPMGLVRIATSGCTLKNLVITEDSHVEGAAFTGGFIGASVPGSGTVTMDRLANHGEVVAHGANAGGIIGCCDDSGATFFLTNSCATGTVIGDKESGAISGWVGTSATLTGCWAVADVSGNDEGKYLYRGSGKITNCYNTVDEQVTLLDAYAVENGELTWRLNGQSFSEPVWYQNIEAGDPYPTFDTTRGIVYAKAGGEFANLYPENEASVATFIKNMAALEQEYVEELVARQELIDTFNALVAELGGTATLEAFGEVYAQVVAQRAELAKSQQAYASYEEAVNSVRTYLEEHPGLTNEYSDQLEEYLDGDLKPGDNEAWPNGSYSYIIENLLLTNEQLEEEKVRMDQMLQTAIANGVVPGTEITSLFTNPRFENGFDGWEGARMTGYGKDEDGIMTAAEYWGSGTFDMYQTITGLENGLYELEIHGAYRPYDDQNALQYYPYIYANGNINYLQADLEGMIPVDEAVDKENSWIGENASVRDREILDLEGNVIGYVMHGIQSACYAFRAGRYPNRVIAEVTDGTLTIGIKNPGSKWGSNEWVGIGDIHVTYQGTLEEAGDGLDEALESMLARAATIMEYVPSTGEDFAQYPGFSQTLRDRIAAAQEAASAAQTAAEKYAVVEELSSVYKEIIECKWAYIDLAKEAEAIYSIASTLSNEDEQATVAILDEVFGIYSDRRYTKEHAQEKAILKTSGYYPTTDENGTVHVADYKQMAYVTTMVNGGQTGLDIVLDNDISVFNEFMMMSSFTGTLDGQNHTIHVDMMRESNDAALFSQLRGGAQVKNLKVEGTISTSSKYAAGVAAHSYDYSLIQNVHSSVNIISGVSGDGTHAGILAVADGASIIKYCLFDGSIIGEGTTSCGGILGWSSVAGTTVQGCLNIADIQVQSASSAVISRNPTNVAMSNCFYLNALGEGCQDNPSAQQITAEELASGMVAYMLNGKLSHKDVVWRQNLGGDNADPMPVLDATHAIVYMADNGDLSNNPNSALDFYSGSEADPYKVATVDELRMLRRYMRTGEVTWIQLEDDIDMAGVTDWTPLNLSTDEASGRGYQNMVHFDGKGHVIRNFTCTNPETSYNSFFGILCGDVTDLGFENANVASTTSGTGILAGYMGHNDFITANGSKGVSTLTNVWVTGKLAVATGYAGGLVGNIGGPSVLTNCYTNVDIQSETDLAGGLIGRVRDMLHVSKSYAAGTMNRGGGIIGGGQDELTPDAVYEDIVVWNNTNSNFGALKGASESVVPKADLLDVVFNEDGSAEDISPMQNTVEQFGTPQVSFNATYGRNTAHMQAEYSKNPSSYYKVTYGGNGQFENALADGHTLEALFLVDYTSIPAGVESKWFSAHEGGGTGFLIANDTRNNEMTFLPHVGGGYCWAQSGIKPQPKAYYHTVGVWDKEAGMAYMYVNGTLCGAVPAVGNMGMPAMAARWFCIGGDASAGAASHGNNWEIVTARVYDRALTQKDVTALWYDINGISLSGGDKTSGIQYYDGNNFSVLQQSVVGWGTPWQCGMADGEYPTFGTSGSGIDSAIQAPVANGSIYTINGIKVERTTKGLYIINGKTVMVK